uniref:NBS-coding resistance gene protein n=1 Tax=Solanum tuberosum TaxID=4113 RepID=M1ACW4_SOLTU
MIIQDMKKEVNHTPLHVASYPIGVDSRTKPIKSLLQNGHIDEVHMVGIYGVGGIGKTTLAKDIYNRLFRDVHFDGSCFLSDVRLLEKKGLERVQEKLLNILFKTEEYKVRTVAEGINLIKRKLGSKKSFSTSRLCWGGERHNQIFSGLPLALVTLGSHLRWESIENWRRKFKRLKEIPRDDIQKTLKKTKILNACGFHTECEIATLVQKQLLQGVLGGCGSGNVQVMRLDEPGELEGVELSTDAFKKMKKLRVLIINGLRIHGDLWHFPKELKWLSWQRCHLKYIPPNFPAANLVVLNMEGSAIEEFGLNFQCCPRLKELNLSWCSALKKTPNFNGATNLETLKLQDDVKQLAEGVRGSISNVIGTHIFVQIYSHIRKNIKSKRDKRKQEEKVIAVVNPMRNAKRKLRIAEKHKAHKKRKMMSMKMDVVECVLL